MRFDGALQDQSYEIVDELQIRKKLESRTDWRFEFTKQTKYGYDLELYRWPDDSDTPSDRELVGYFELERADDAAQKSWVTGPVPKDDWFAYTFLKRKLYQRRVGDGICRKEGCSHRVVKWGNPKPETHMAVFLKFNHNLDNCFAVPLRTVVREGEQTPKSIECDPANSYRSLPLDHPKVREGIDNVVDFIDEYLTNRQTALVEYDF